MICWGFAREAFPIFHPDRRFLHETGCTNGDRRAPLVHPVFRSEAERQALMAEYERWDGTRIGFCEAKGVHPGTLMGLLKKRDPAAPGLVEIAAESG